MKVILYISAVLVSYIIFYFTIKYVIHEEVSLAL